MFKVLQKREKYVDINLLFLLVTLNIFHTFSSVSDGYFEQVNIIEVTSKLPHAAANVAAYTRHTSSLQCSNWYWIILNYGEWRANGGIY